MIDAVLELNGEWQAKQTISGETDPNSGGNVVFLSPGVRVASNRWSGFVSVWPADHQRSERPAIGANLSADRGCSSRLLTYVAYGSAMTVADPHAGLKIARFDRLTEQLGSGAAAGTRPSFRCMGLMRRAERWCVARQAAPRGHRPWLRSRGLGKKTNPVCANGHARGMQDGGYYVLTGPTARSLDFH